jgi:hypothetical protein
MLGGVKGYARFALGLRRFLAEPVSPERARQIIEGQLRDREQSFLRIVERGVYARPDSPYYKLMTQAKIGIEDIRLWVKERGIEGALHALYDAGVYVSAEEFRRRTPIKRPGLEIDTRAEDFSNPFLTTAYEARSSGSTGRAQRVFIDLDFIGQETAQTALFHAAHGNLGRPLAVWRPAPPDASGLVNELGYARLGRKSEHWFSQARPGWRGEDLRANVLLNFTLLACRLMGRPLSRPEFVPRDRAIVVARWLVEKKRQGRPGYVATNASSATRVCLAAMEQGLDIEGSAMSVSGEPFTAAKAAVLLRAGVHAVEGYTMAQLGGIALGCADEDVEGTDLHVMSQKLAVIQKDKQVGDETRVPALVYTTLLPHLPTLLINVESGDYGAIEERDCACLFGEVGLRTHILGPRGYDKLTSEGVTFLGDELLRLVEEVLPARFGGNPADYQLVEEEEGGLTKVGVLVAPSVGAVDEEELTSTVLKALEKHRGGPLMADQWRQGKTLRVIRRELYLSGSRKVLPLYVMEAARR